MGPDLTELLCYRYQTLYLRPDADAGWVTHLVGHLALGHEQVGTVFTQQQEDDAEDWAWLMLGRWPGWSNGTDRGRC